MRYRPLGERGPTVSVVGVGGNNFGARLDEDGTKAVVHAALDTGITLCGGGSLLYGLSEAMSEVLSIPARVWYPGR